MTPDPLLSERQTSAALNLSTATLRRWRKARRRGEMGDSAGPAFVDLNGSIRYRPRDCLLYTSSGRTNSSGEVVEDCFERSRGLRDAGR